MTGIIDRNGFIMKNADRQTGTLRLERNPFNLLFSDKAESLFPQAPLLNQLMTATKPTTTKNATNNAVWFQPQRNISASRGQNRNRS